MLTFASDLRIDLIDKVSVDVAELRTYGLQRGGSNIPRKRLNSQRRMTIRAWVLA